ncbi:MULTISPECIES: DCC1-like thiol-disulfide oxidoreductase family protein [Agrobacterium]|uniref:DCC family thiol-disulfide oxidoreductase YuxK n=1 Tax=Agrobacterium larrymoorei TaxID=160699 RepID=A0ABU0UK33_9HYPH|nr:DCC1-like thiol-disulfide oxidoreductase family protein [Agrobacterium larrymoorei]MDQ1185312.1 putative DCC family thiol-disulfide oxidoreductase YuxK [Agrobacterium larrymoorei]MDQ1197843.1 putative DCC family thiol-disulfide oxidoreductase YuxK [Rhizobium sp. SORGH_AS_0787]
MSAAYSYRNDPSVPHFLDDKPLIIFDGECGFCSRDIDFVLRRDKQGLFRFTPAQSPLGAALMRHYGFRTDDYETSLLIENGVVHAYSDSVLRVIELLGGMLGMTATVMRLVPRFLRDRVYRLVARNRMKIAGRRQTCRAPTPQERERFL